MDREIGSVEQSPARVREPREGSRRRGVTLYGSMVKEDKIAEIRFARRRMIVGAIIGFSLFSLFSMFMLHINGWLAEDVAMNPYLGPPPMMTAGLFGFFGFVIGALLGLFSKRWKQFK